MKYSNNFSNKISNKDIKSSALEMHVISTPGWGLHVWQTKTVTFFIDLMQTPRTCNSFFFFFFNRLKNIDSYSEDFQKKNFRQIWWNCTNEYRLLLINPKEILLNWLFFLYPWFLCSSYFFSASSRAIAFRTWVWIVHTMRHWVSLEKEEKKVCLNDH